MMKIAIFASGSGTNAAKIIEYFGSRGDISVELVVSNRDAAGVLGVANSHSVKAKVFPKEVFDNRPKEVLAFLRSRDVGFIALAGFLLKFPESLVSAFDGRILNIHPSLLPAYGGKGMYGDHVHKAVLESNEEVSGITIHEVNNEYDRGEIVFQKEVSLEPTETLESLKRKIQTLEHRHFAQVIETAIKNISK